jgi:lysophospholipid acyltransferase (LPLAT)-like uncharacterized protein
MAARVDNVTGLKWLAVEVFGHATAWLARAAFAIVRATVRVRHEGAVPAPGETRAVTCAWHEHLPAVFVTTFPTSAPTIWMNHPAWYMRPIHLLLDAYGVHELALGSSGHGGRGALAVVIEAVKDGRATFLNPDGPHGPAHVVKDGVLEIARLSGQPVTALSFGYRGAVRLPTWDRKWLPLPFGAVVVRWSAPLDVGALDREAARAALAAALSDAPARRADR